MHKNSIAINPIVTAVDCYALRHGSAALCVVHRTLPLLLSDFLFRDGRI